MALEQVYAQGRDVAGWEVACRGRRRDEDGAIVLVLREGYDPVSERASHGRRLEMMARSMTEEMADVSA